jgi:GNAT superfamily N-acetyltransferase
MARPMQRGMTEIQHRTETLRGEALLPVLPALARLRMAVFAEWPYLYAGEDAHERRYLAGYAASPGAAIVVAFAGDEAVGAATCQPMSEASDAVRAAFAGEDLARWCYFGESVLLQAHRGRGLGHAFFDAREAHARALGCSHAAFCAVERASDDPRRPEAARDLAPFWRRRGYAHAPARRCVFEWREIGSAEETQHTLSFWTRAL